MFFFVYFLNLVTTSLDYNIYLYGIEGCGKSYLLYQLACRLMNDNIVIYVSRSYDLRNFLHNLYLECASEDNRFEELNETLKELGEIIKSHEFDNRLKTAEYILDKIKVQLKKPLIFVVDQIEMINTCPYNSELVDFVKNVFLKRTL